MSGDTLTTITVNYRWRSLIAAATEFYYRDYFQTEDELDNQDAFSAFLEDLYTAESLGSSMAYTIQGVDIGTNRTTSATSFGQLTGSSFLFTPSKANFIVRCSNIILSNSGSFNTIAQIRFNALAGAVSANAIMNGTTARTLAASAKFESVSVGVEHSLELYWRVSGGTGTANASSFLLFEIEEYD